MEGDDKKKAHRVSKSSRKIKKSKDGKKEENVDPRIRNPKAFAINSVVRAERKFRRSQDIKTKKERAPKVDRTPVEPPPFIIAIVGPSKVGKSTLFHNLIKHFTRQTLHDIKGPVTIVSGKKRRLTLIECNNDINSMIDTAKVADLVLLLVDASFGFEMEIFEFLNICQVRWVLRNNQRLKTRYNTMYDYLRFLKYILISQVHGFPQIMGVLTHLDLFKNKTQLKKTKKTLKHRFWTEVYPGSKLFYLSGYHPMTNAYPKNEVHNLARFISVMKFRQTQWRSEHSYVIADRMEDLTSLDDIRINPKADRNICLYGYVHGTFLKPGMAVHIPGLGDYTPEAVTALADPCPLPMKDRVLRRSLNEKEKVIYAPFSGVGGIVYDHDAVYIDLGGSHSYNRRSETENGEVGSETVSPFVFEMRNLKSTLDKKMQSASLQIFSASGAITSAEVEDDVHAQFNDADKSENENNPEQPNIQIIPGSDGRLRRKVVFDDDDDVTSEVQSEIKKLKKAIKKNDAGLTGRELEAEGDYSVGKASIQFKEVATNADESVMSLATKLKARLKKSKEDSSKVKSVPAPSQPPPPRGQSEESKSSDDELDEESEQESEHQNDENDYGENTIDQGEGVEEQYEFGEDPWSVEIMKKKRYADAEAGFHSRFYKRSLQKMIYDDSTDYLHVGPKADFDLANCTVQEVQGKSGSVMASEEKLKNLFVGGNYADAAESLLEADDENSKESFGGDFQELDKDDVEEAEQEGLTLDPEVMEETKSKKREEMKKKLKEKFDMQYDGGDDDVEKSFYKDWKDEVEEQTRLNRTFFKEVDDPSLLQDLQGLAPGSYVRFLLLRLPYEFIANFDPQAACPLILGSLDSPNQETLAVIQARVKKHRWHPKILKTRDPIILSVGWRRFQTMSLYSVHDHNMRNRMIKYTPEHLHCVANFYGPITPQGTGILGIAPRGFDGFRITLTGTILDMDKSTELVKKLKLIGHPAKIFKKSAFVNGMFNSQLEVARFVGAKIKSVSGIRGVIKKPLRTPPGSFRATFEDRVLLSDVIFCRTWAKVEVPKFYLSIPNLIIAQPRLVKTLGQLKREGEVKTEPNPDHLYTHVERTVKEFKPMQIPRKLQERLPYKDKPKVQAKVQELQRIAVIKEPHERKMTALLKVMKSRMHEKEAKEKAEKAKKTNERGKIMKKLEENQNHRQKELRKKIFRTLGKMKPKQDAVSGGGRGIRRQFQKRR